MDDLISRKALREAMYHEAFEMDSDMQKWDSGCWIRYKMFENHLKDAPSVPAVPLDKLCRMLAKYIGFPCNYSPIDEEMADYCGDQCEMDDIGCWEKVLSKLMEEQHEKEKG